MGDWLIGVDLGGTRIRAVAAAPDGRWPGDVYAAETPAFAGAVALLQAVGDAVAAAAARAGIAPEQVAAMGVGVPGPLDRQHGVLLGAPNLSPGEYPVGPYLQQRFGRPVRVENDANAAALGEHRVGAGQGTADMLYLGIGTGVGGGIIIGGRLYTGTGNAGELGHMIVDPNGPPCGCGGNGCLEALASGTAIGRMGREAGWVTGAAVAAAAAHGDPLARTILDRAAVALGSGIGALINAFAPQRVVLGGGVVEGLGAPWVRQVAAAARRRAMAPARDLAAVVAGALGGAAGLHGVLALAAAPAAPADAEG